MLQRSGSALVINNCIPSVTSIYYNDFFLAKSETRFGANGPNCQLVELKGKSNY